MSASPQALAAIRAVKNANKWGPQAARLFCLKRGAYPLYLAAIAFERRRKS